MDTDIPDPTLTAAMDTPATTEATIMESGKTKQNFLCICGTKQQICLVYFFRKRSAESEPTAAAEAEADPKAYYGRYGYYGGYYGRPYGYSYGYGYPYGRSFGYYYGK